MTTVAALNVRLTALETLLKTSLHVALGPTATGLDQTLQLYNWLKANQGRTCQLPPTLPGKPFRVAGLRWPSATRILGSGCGPFTDQNPGTYFAPVAGYTGDLTYGEPLGEKNIWSHGTIVEGIAFRNNTGDQATVGLRFCGGEVSAIRDCAFTGFSHAGIKLVGGNAPFFAENLSLYGNGAGFWVYNSGGAIAFVNLSGDDNNCMGLIENTDNDPNGSGGRIVAITILNLKAETGNYRSGAAASTSHRPLFRFVRANEASLKIVGGVVEDWGSAADQRTKALVHIENPGPDAAGRAARSAHVSIDNLKVDQYKYGVVDDVLGTSTDISAAITWPTFTPLYHDHRIIRTTS